MVFDFKLAGENVRMINLCETVNENIFGGLQIYNLLNE